MADEKDVLIMDDQPTPAPAPAKPDPEAKPEEKPSKAEREELAALKRQLAEKDEEARFWARKAQEQPKPEAKPKPKAEEPKPESPDEFIEDLTRNGAQAIMKRIPKGASLDEIRDLIKQELGGFTTMLNKQGALAQEFPELADPKSKFAQMVDAELSAAEKDDPDFERTTSTLRIAARAVRAKLEAEKARDEREADRRRRISAQDYGGEPVEDGEDGLRITRQDLTFAQAMGISPEDFKKSKAKVHGARRAVVRS